MTKPIVVACEMLVQVKGFSSLALPDIKAYNHATKAASGLILFYSQAAFV